MPLFLSALGASADLDVDYSRPAWLDPCVDCDAIAFWSAGVRLVDVVVPHTPGGARLYIAPDTEEYLAELDVDASDALDELVIRGAQVRAQQCALMSPPAAADLPPQPRRNPA